MIQAIVDNMELNTMERYVEFICNELPETKKVRLNQPPPKDDNDFGYLRFPKLGPNVYSEVKITIVEKYTRSAKLRLEFDGYVVEDLLFMSRHKGPDQLLFEIDTKISKLINKTFIDDGKEEWIRDQYNEKGEKFSQISIK